MTYETDAFRILNLSQLTSNYRLFEIAGMSRSDEEYENNIQHIIRSLSFSLQHPITIIHIDDRPYLVVKDDAAVIAKVPVDYPVKKGEYVRFTIHGESLKLDFDRYDDETKSIIIRFLQFDLQNQLSRVPSLWQPGAGSPFFSKQCYDGDQDVAIHNGFLPRIAEMPGGGFGIYIDVTKKYLAKRGLPVHLTRSEFKKLGVNKSHFIYRYGKKWFDIKPEDFSDLNVSQIQYDRLEDGKKTSLIEDIRNKFRDEMPPEVASLPDDAAALIYRTNARRDRRAAASLCFRIYDSEELGKLHRESIIDPFFRRKFIRTVRTKYFNDVWFGDLKLEIAQIPEMVSCNVITPPDLEFGGHNVLSVRGTPDAIHTDIAGMGKVRKTLLTDPEIGFFTKAPFDREYFLLPETVYNTYGGDQCFLGELKKLVDKMHRVERGYMPKVITYDDRNKRTSTDIGFEILERIKAAVDSRFPSYAVVMLPAGIERDKRAHDELAALVVSECQDANMLASIMHGDTLKECFEYSRREERYVVRPNARGKYQGYVFGVAVNQVLLNNERWPFVLKTPLNADLTVGIDVKQYIAGFTFVDKMSKNILTKFDRSTNKEKLSVSQLVKVLVKFIRLQAQHAVSPISKIVIHRDGRLFDTEKEGIMKALTILIGQGVLPGNAMVSIVEIPKAAIVPFRLFDVLKAYNIFKTDNDNGLVLNPKIGTVAKIGGREAYLCSTGREFPRRGTVRPLLIKYVHGVMDFDEILQDIYFLTCLAFTKPDDCSRDPLTIKITDRRINSLGSDYNSEELDILKAASVTI